jgi:hypothetical protein
VCAYLRAGVWPYLSSMLRAYARLSAACLAPPYFSTLSHKRQALLIASKEIGLEVNAEKLSTWSCLEIRTQDKMGTYR